MVNFVNLPPSVHDKIFLYADVTSFTNLYICKQLLPSARRSLYDSVGGGSPKQLRQFAASLLTEPALLTEVHILAVERMVQDEADDEEMGDGGSGFFAQEQISARPYEPSRVQVGYGLIKEMIRAMPRLHTLNLSGQDCFFRILTERYLSRNPLDDLRYLALNFDRPQVDAEIEYLSDPSFLRRVLSLPSLRFFALGGESGPLLPISTLNIDLSTHLAPRTCPLLQLYVTGGDGTAPFRFLLSALIQVQDFNLHLVKVSPTFADDIACLPPTVTSLNLSVGLDCGPQLPAVEAPFRLGRTLDCIPLLSQLSLQGDIVDEDSLRSIGRLSSLTDLRFGSHIFLPFFHLVSYIGSPTDPPKLPLLKNLVVDCCVCVSYDASEEAVQQRATRKRGVHTETVWNRGFDAKDSEELFRRAHVQGVYVEGGIRCLVDLCQETDEHWRFCIWGKSRQPWSKIQLKFDVAGPPPHTYVL